MHSKETEPARSKKLSWVYSVVPVSIASVPVSTLVQLYLIELNGISLGTIYVGLAAAISSGVGIPAAMFWGLAADRVHRLRAIIVTSYLATAVILTSIFFEGTTSGVILAYSVFSFVSIASSTPLSLLIMETEQKGKWATVLARLSMMASIGNVGGLLLSTIWVEELPLLLLSVPLGLFSLFSAALAFFTIAEPAFAPKRETVTMGSTGSTSSLLAPPSVSSNVPGRSDLSAIQGLRSGLASYVVLFYISSVLFSLATALFNTSFVPAMSAFSITQGAVFGVLLTGTIVQVIAFRFVGAYVVKLPLVTSTVQGCILRSIAYAAIGVAAVLAQGPSFVVPALVLYPLAVGVSYAIYITSSSTIMFNIVQYRNPGSGLGVYSAVTGVAAMVGSILSGFVSVYLGYYVTFAAAGALVFLAAVVALRLKTAGFGPTP